MYKIIGSTPVVWVERRVKPKIAWCRQAIIPHRPAKEIQTKIQTTQNKKKIIFVSYATINTPYIDELNRHLLPSLEKFNLEYDIEYIKDLGSWQANTSYKSTCLLKMLQKHKCAIVFLDADAEVRRYPSLFWKALDGYDVGVHFLDWMWRWRKIVGQDQIELLSGTMYLDYNPKVMSLVSEFITEVMNHPDLLEQASIHRVVSRRNDLKIYELPYSYIVFPNQDGQLPLHMISPNDVVIYHSQASRKLKRWCGKRE